MSEKDAVNVGDLTPQQRLDVARGEKVKTFYTPGGTRAVMADDFDRITEALRGQHKLALDACKKAWAENEQLRTEVERLTQESRALAGAGLIAMQGGVDERNAEITRLRAQLAQQQVPDGWRDLLRRAREFVDMWDDDSQEFMDLCGDIDNALAAAPAPARCEFHGADPDACQTYSGEVPCAPVQQPYKCATCCDSGIVGHSMLCTECNGAPVQAEPARGVV